MQTWIKDENTAIKTRAQPIFESVIGVGRVVQKND